MANGYNSVTLIGRVKHNISVKPYRKGVQVRFFLEVEDLDFDPVYAKYKKHKEIFRIVFDGYRAIPYDSILAAHPYLQVYGKLHTRTFKEKILGDKAFEIDVKTTRRGIVFLDEVNSGEEMLFYNAPKTSIQGPQW